MEHPHRGHAAGQHDHLMFGEGEVDFKELFEGLQSIGYSGGAHVELSRHSHDAVGTARRSLEFLQKCLWGLSSK
jgi:sugar phosphate isomerase/epimerase